jgi:hypothetical protein
VAGNSPRNDSNNLSSPPGAPKPPTAGKVAWWSDSGMTPSQWECRVTPTTEQILQALINTVHQPRSDARLIYEAFKREQATKTPAATGAGIPWLELQGEPV